MAAPVSNPPRPELAGVVDQLVGLGFDELESTEDEILLRSANRSAFVVVARRDGTWIWILFRSLLEDGSVIDTSTPIDRTDHPVLATLYESRPEAGYHGRQPGTRDPGELWLAHRDHLWPWPPGDRRWPATTP